MSSAINYFHIFAVAPALAYLLNENRLGRAISSQAATFGLVVVLFVVVYHAFLAFQKMPPATATDIPVAGSTVNNDATAAVNSEEFLAKGSGGGDSVSARSAPTGAGSPGSATY